MQHSTALNGEGTTHPTSQPAEPTTVERAIHAAYLRGVIKGTTTPPADRTEVQAAAAEALTQTAGTAKPAPAWLTTPCPAWCIDRHGEGDHPDDRLHVSRTLSQPLLTMDPVNYGPPTEPDYRPLELTGSLTQHYLQAEARIVIDDTEFEFARYLTLDEAEGFAGQLLELVRAARSNVFPANRHPGSDEHREIG